MAWVLFHTFLEKQEDGNAIDLDGTDDIRCMLVTSVRAPVQATDTDMVTIDNTEVATGTSYTAGGYQLTNTITLAAGTVTFDSDNATWVQDASGFTNARYAILYKYTGVPSAETPIAYADLGGDKSIVTGDLTLEMDAAGIFTKTTS